jgi:hypothetical protein
LVGGVGVVVEELTGRDELPALAPGKGRGLVEEPEVAHVGVADDLDVGRVALDGPGVGKAGLGFEALEFVPGDAVFPGAVGVDGGAADGEAAGAAGRRRRSSKR